MSYFLSNSGECTVNVDDFSTVNGVTFYKISIKVGCVCWTTSHRFNEFVELHDSLVADHGVAKDLLPPKKVIRNKTPKFIEQRREALNEYLKNVLNYLKLTMPPVFAKFLDFHLYDIFFILQSLAMKFYTEGDKLLSDGKTYKFTPLELHSISERLKIPCPQMEKIDKIYDFCHILDFVTQLHSIHVEGTYDKYGSSNIIPNTLKFDFSCFKSLKSLFIHGVPMSCIQGVGTLRDSLKKLTINVANVTSINEFLLCDVVHKDQSSITTGAYQWKNLTTVDFGSNNIEVIDWGVKLVPKLEKFVLSSNNLTDISDLLCLPHLSMINLSLNKFEMCEDWHSKLGNIVSIDLSQNKVYSLKAFGKLYSLESLNLSCNNVTDVEEIQNICRLPCLEYLWLTANPVAAIIDYRVKVLEQFNTRMSDICLDNERPSSKELDTARVLQALRIVRTGKTPDFLMNNNSSLSQKS